MRHICFLSIAFIVATATAQTGNIGIGTTTPGSKLTDWLCCAEYGIQQPQAGDRSPIK